MMTTTKNLLAINQLITDFEQKYHHEKNSVHLLAVSKGQSLEKIEEAIAAGQYAFGESYVQEALPKIAALKNKNIEWHFIGPIQSNKTRKIAEHFDWVHSVDNIKIAKRLNEQRPVHLPPLNICLEVNLDHEATKSGLATSDILPLAQYCSTLPQLKLRGLMAIPAHQDEFSKQRKSFQQLFMLYQMLRTQGFSLDTLSMGMSDDFEAAIAEGSTLVRIGTAIFGARS